MLMAQVQLCACLGPLSIPPGARVSCDDDGDCPTSLVCDQARTRCVPEQGPCVDGGTALPDGLPCETDRLCVAGFCVASSCGDGVLDVAAGEQCDQGDANADLEPGHCRSDCTPPRCGDGVVDVDEGCDDASNPHCSDCDLVCPVERSDCDGSGECECTLDALPVTLTRVFAAAADDDALYLAATGAGPGISLLRRAHDADGDAELLADGLDLFGDIMVVGDAIVLRDGAIPSMVPTAGGPVTPLFEPVIDLAVDGDAFVTFDDELPTTRVTLDGATSELGPPVPACTSGVVIDGVPYASTDLGAVVRVDADGLAVLAERQFEITGVQLATDGRALWWLDDRGDLWRLDPAIPDAIRVAQAPPSLVGARPYDLQVDVRGFAWRAELGGGLTIDDVVVVGAAPAGPRMRARPGSVVDTLAIAPTVLCFSSFDDVYCLPR
ncbi:MAG: hypothetical protein A2138_03215 [Deltaproteobacteria bacterium RBG_16_71_12]|nr:MAG: hypothetical protein A2138_03215 [Deltaproteobacteria bacterium RBG_16_71_12]